MSAGPFLGVVLAGGASRRMGRDKALLPFAGEPLWRRQVRTLRSAGLERVILIRKRGQTPFENEAVPHFFDRFEEAGPMAGLDAALRAGSEPWIAVLAVDMPSIDASWFQRLMRLCAPGRGAIGGHAEAFEPLAAIYPRTIAGEVTGRLNRRETSLQSLVRDLAGSGILRRVSLPPAERARMQSLNSPRDLSHS